ncbi:uncharacterized protein LOC121413079 [Lytechinus variegatus]|uniref:uncharacterized protein LOC121413079 n=1 Tax=Lytechinus variegatus TaxID=7654 RepID=UPI001BB0E491|nr:uncharacterized protein LOC121413079 [Lytechinus variegatus]
MSPLFQIERLDIDDIKLSQRQSASRDLAQFICKMPHLRELHLGDAYRNTSPSLHDEFYSTLSSLASSAKIERLIINYFDLSQRQSASCDLAQFICKMPHLRELHLGDTYRNISPSPHDEFYSTLSSLASSAKIEHLDIEYIDLSQRQSASRDLAQFICKMPHLRELHLGDRYGITSPSLHEEFYSTLSSLASSAKIERLNIKYIDLSQRQSTSRDLAQFICKMPHLRELHLGDRYGTTSPSLHEEFYSTLSSLASSAKIECLDINGIDLSQRQSASRHLAQFICMMPNLRELHLGDRYGTTSPSLHDKFYSTLSSLALSAKIECLDINGIDLSQRQSASRDLAQFICMMPNLRELHLGDRYGTTSPSLHDKFYSTLSSLALSAKIECLDIHYINLSQRRSASCDLAQFICKMPHLRELCLGDEYYRPTSHDEFYSTLAYLASSAKIEILHLRENLSERPSASRDLALFICKMNHLKNLKLCGRYHDDFYSTSSSMASSAKGNCNTSSNVSDLTVTDRTLNERQDCGSMFDNVKRITIQVRRTIRCDVIQRIHLPAATELTIQTYEYAWEPASLHDDPTSLPNALHKVSFQLVKVTFTDLNIGNSEVRNIIQAFRSSDDLKLLKSARYDIFSLFDTPFGHDERLSVDI